jgi:hypothetical protein
MNILSVIAASRRRGGGFDPLDLSPEAWYSDTGADFAQWDDLSGNVRHLLQASGLLQPSIVSSALKGRQVRRFDGINDFMQCASFGADYQTKSVYLVVQRSSTGNRAPLGNRGVSEGWMVRLTDTGGLFAHPGTATNVTTTADSKTACIIRAVSTASEIKLKIAATENTTGTGSYASSSNAFMVGADGRPAEYYAGDIAEVLIFSSVLSSGDDSDLVAFLTDKWL